MKPQTVTLFNSRFEEGYDVEDELYQIWSSLKSMNISSPEHSISASSPTSSNDRAPLCESSKNQLSVSVISCQNQLSEVVENISPALEDILVYSDPKPAKGKSTSEMPMHLSGEQMIACLEHKDGEKKRLEAEKRQRGEERIRKRKEREEKIQRKKAERERKKKEQEQKKKEKELNKQRAASRGRGCGRGCGKGKGGARIVESQVCADISNDDSSSVSDSKDDYVCTVCEASGGKEWVACDSCHIWYHQGCVNIPPGVNLEEIDWFCVNCEQWRIEGGFHGFHGTPP